MNSITIFGNLGRDAEQRQVGSTSLASFPLACKRQKKKDEEKAGTDWFDVTIWGNRSALAQHLKKGVPVVVTGRLEFQTFQKQDGSQGTKLAVNCHDISFAGGSGNGQQKPAAPPAVAKPAENFDDIFASADEIPF